MAIKITRAHLDKALTAAMMFNSAAAVISAVLFFISQWWIFIILGTIGLPFTLCMIFLFKYTRLRNPIQKYAINFVVKIYEGLIQKRGMLIKKAYTAACWVVPNDQWKHINWGYAELTPKSGLSIRLNEGDEEKKFYNQLYHRLSTGLGNWNTLEGKNVLEIRSGGGGGLNYLTKYLNPNKCIGIETSTTQTGACEENMGESKLRFYSTDQYENFAQVPELEGEKIDLALTLQSSQHIRDFGKFIKEVDSVLRPGGIFAFTDLRLAEDWAQVEKDLEGSSMKIIKNEDISHNVIQALKLDELAKWQLINRRLGSMIKSAATHLMKRIGVVKNNALAESLNTGTSQAKAYVLFKPPQAELQAY